MCVCVCVVCDGMFSGADGLLKMLYRGLLNQQLRHPGAPKTQAAVLQAPPLQVHMYSPPPPPPFL